MRQREQHDLSDEARRELDALDRALAGEPVDAEFDAVARLARDMRAARPEALRGLRGPARRAGRERVSRPSTARPRRSPIRVREWFAGVRPMRLLAPAGAVATVLIVASVAVIQSGGGEDATTPTTADDRDATPPAPAGGAPGPRRARSAAGATRTPARPSRPRRARATSPKRQRRRAASAVAPGSEREVERSATLTLSAEGEEFDDVGRRRRRGHRPVPRLRALERGELLRARPPGPSSSSRSPPTRLQAALADLSALAHVEARSEDAVDITAQSVTARQRLTDARAQVEGLLGQLANADTTEGERSDRLPARRSPAPRPHRPRPSSRSSPAAPTSPTSGSP